MHREFKDGGLNFGILCLPRCLCVCMYVCIYIYVYVYIYIYLAGDIDKDIVR